MSDENSGGSEKTLQEALSSGTPVFVSGGDPDDPTDPLNRQPMNIAAVVWSYLEEKEASESDRMRTFSMRMEEWDHTRLVLLADALGTSKTTLARELLEKAIGEAYRALPEDIREELRGKLFGGEGEVG